MIAVKTIMKKEKNLRMLRRILNIGRLLSFRLIIWNFLSINKIKLKLKIFGANAYMKYSLSYRMI